MDPTTLVGRSPSKNRNNTNIYGYYNNNISSTVYSVWRPYIYLSGRGDDSEKKNP